MYVATYVATYIATYVASDVVKRVYLCVLLAIVTSYRLKYDVVTSSRGNVLDALLLSLVSSDLNTLPQTETLADL